MESPPGAATIRVTAADAREAVARVEEELEVSRSNMRTLVPTTGPTTSAPSSSAAESEDDPDDAHADRPTLVPTKAPSATDSFGERRTDVPTKDPSGEEPEDSLGERRTDVPTKAPAAAAPGAPGRLAGSSPASLDAAELDADAEDSDVLPVAFDDDADPAVSRPSEAIAPTMPSDRMGTDALSVVRPMPFPPPRPAADGMRWGATVALAGLLALSLGGLSAYLMLGGNDSDGAPAPGTAAAADATPASTSPAASVGAESTTTGRVEVRAIEGARVEVDGEDRGEAPVPLELSVGEHRLRVTAPGHHPWQTTVDVKAGANAAVTAELVPMDTVVVVPSSTPEAKPGEAKPGASRPKPGASKPKADTKPGEAKPEPKPKDEAKPKPEVFMDASKGKDNGIFLPVGGK